LPSLPAGQYTPLGPTVVLLFLDASQHQDNSDGRLASFSSRSSVKNLFIGYSYREKRYRFA
ncbi:MAG: hypothetical protein KJ634_07560, partial [Gammaproteobacteria bacterium]|nr:hypothetical protein [Gammaproteobacteria bacterium]MBU1415465.1 hypothetical protein [Gammaproteobacteria bacterium]